MTGCRISATLYDAEDRAVKVTARYHPATEAYYARDPGCYLPGDSDEVELISVRALDEGANVAEVEADTERIEEAIRVAWSEED